MVDKIVSPKHPLISKKIDDSLNKSIKEGSFATASSGLGLSYFSPFALAMNATSSQIGILNAVISLFQGIVQLSGPKIISRFSRKKVILTAGILEVLLIIPIILTGFLFYRGFQYSIWIFIVLVGLFYGIQAIIFPAWFSWMGSLVSEEKRGKYFSKRNKLSEFSGVLALVLGALVLDFTKKLGIKNGEILGYTLYGFGIIFCIAMILRLISLYIFSKQYEPKLITKKKDYFSFWQFLKKSRQTPFGRFTIFRGFFALAVGIANPFWIVYMIKDLGFSYFWFMAVTVLSVLFQIYFYSLWGKFSDKFGNIKLIKISLYSIFLVPFIWAFTYFLTNDLIIKIWILLVASLVGGFGWAGFNLAVNNYVYDSVKSEKREHGVSYMNLIVGIGSFLGAIIGTIIVYLDINFMNPLIFVFLISGTLRLIIAYFGSPYLKEVRHVERFSSHFIVKEFSPMKGAIKEIHHLEHLTKRVEHHI